MLLHIGNLICLIALAIVMRIVVVVAEHVCFVRSILLWLLALRLDEVDSVHNDLLKHQNGEKQATDTDQLLVDEGRPGHTEVTVEEA